MLQKYVDKYLENLTGSVVPFWLKHSVDHEFGGFFTCLEKDGSVYDTRKYVGLNGRAIWTFCRLYSELDSRQEYFDAAERGIQFLDENAQDRHGRYFFSLTREGKPFFLQRKASSASGCMLGFLEWYRLTGEKIYLHKAIELFWRVADWVEHPELVGQTNYPGKPRMSKLGGLVMVAGLVTELARQHEDVRYKRFMKRLINLISAHYDMDRRILLEHVCLNGTDMSMWPEGRLIAAGNVFQAAWLLLEMEEFVPEVALEKMALSVVEGTLEYAWDKEYGGLYYFVDVLGKPATQMEASMKLWWPHVEAIYAASLAYKITREQKWLEWVEVLDSYASEHFIDSEFGGWFGYCSRQGLLANTAKGGSYKGFYRVPRALMATIDLLDEVIVG